MRRGPMVRRRFVLVGWAFASLMIASCGDTTAPTDAGPDASDASSDSGTDGAIPGDAGGPITSLGPTARPARLLTPDASALRPAPLILLLHGYGPSDISFAFLLELAEQARMNGFYAVVPDGTLDSAGARFWNANPACCDVDGIGVDDVAYLRGLIDEAVDRLPIDPSRVVFFGHSNGGFMSYRMACEASDSIAGIVSLAGTDDPMDGACVPARPVSVLHIHGDADLALPYEGGANPLNGIVVPGAEATLARWLGYAGCDAAAGVTGSDRDYEVDVAGAETVPTAYERDCRDAAVLELWRMRGAGHRPVVDARFLDGVIDWLSARSR